jgi:RNA polymerase sigma-B factor
VSLVEEDAPSRSPLVPEEVRRRPSSFVPDGQWQPGVRRPAAVGVAGRAPQWGTDLPGSLLTELAGLAVDDPSRARLRARVIEWYLPMAAYLARRFGGRGEPLDDLTQVAAVGLIKAVDRFDPARGVELSAYAVPTIVGEIKRHFRDTTWVVRVPRRLQELKLRLPAAAAELAQTLCREPTSAELAQRLGTSPRDVVSAQLLANAYSPRRIERGSGRLDLSPRDRLGGPDPGLDAVDNRTTLRLLLASLPVREQRILVLRFEQDMSQAEIAAEVGLSQMHVSRLLVKCLARLHGGLVGEVPPSGGQATRGGRQRSPGTPAPAMVPPLPGAAGVAA